MITARLHGEHTSVGTHLLLSKRHGDGAWPRVERAALAAETAAKKAQTDTRSLGESGPWDRLVLCGLWEAVVWLRTGPAVTCSVAGGQVVRVAASAGAPSRPSGCTVDSTSV